MPEETEIPFSPENLIVAGKEFEDQKKEEESAPAPNRSMSELLDSICSIDKKPFTARKIQDIQEMLSSDAMDNYIKALRSKILELSAEIGTMKINGNYNKPVMDNLVEQARQFHWTVQVLTVHTDEDTLFVSTLKILET